MAISWASTNVQTQAQAVGRLGIVQAYIEGIPEIFCTKTPPDKKSKNKSLAFVIGPPVTYASSSAVTNLVSSGDFSVLAWVKPTDLTSRGSVINWFHTAGGAHGFSCEIDITSGKLKLNIDGNLVTATTAAVVAGKWNLCGWSLGGLNGGEVRYFVQTLNADGSVTETVEYDSYASASVPNRTTRLTWPNNINDPIYVGSYQGSALPLNGRIGMVQVWDRALTFSEMRRMAYRILDAKWPSAFWTNLRAQWQLEEGSGTLCRDSSSNTYSLTFAAGGAAPTWQSDPPFTITYKALMSSISSIGQTLSARANRTTISGISFRVLDTYDWLTSRLQVVGLAVRQKSAYIFMGFDGILEDEYQVIFSGAVESIDPLAGRGYEIKLGDALRFLRQSIILGQTTLSGAMAAGDASASVTSIYGFQATTNASQGAGNPSQGYIKIDSEIMLYTAAAAGSFTVTRAQLGTTAAAHSNGATVKEILVVGSAIIDAKKLLLQLMLSQTGDQCCESSVANAGQYDILARFTANDPTLTEGRGAGMSVADVDIAGIEAAFNPNAYVGALIIDKSIQDIQKFCEDQLLLSLGAFFFVRADGRISVGTWAAPSYGSAPTVKAGDVQRPTTSIAWTDIINSIVANCDYRAKDGSYNTLITYDDTTSGKSYGRLNPLQYNSQWIGNTDFAGTAASTVIANMKTVLFNRYLNPTVVYQVTVGLRYLIYEVGDGVYLQHSNLPDLTFGARNLLGVACQVVSRTLDFKRSRVVLELQRVPGQAGR